MSGNLKFSEATEDGVDVELSDTIDISLNMRRELVERLEDDEQQMARLVIEGDVTSVDIAFVALTQMLGVSQDQIDEALEAGRNGS